MKNLKMNMSKFKKISSDKKSTTFQHDEGHQMIIARKALSPSMRKELDAMPMADGGVAKKASKDDISEAKAEDAAAMQSGATGEARPKSKVTQGDNYSSTAITHPQADSNDMKAYMQKMYQQKSGVGMYAEGGDTADQIAQDAMANPPAEAPQEPGFAQNLGHEIGDAVRGSTKGYGQFLGDLVRPIGNAATGLVQGIAGQPNAVMTDEAPPQPTEERAPASVDQGPANPPQPQANPSAVDTSVPGAMQSGLNLQMQGLQNQYKAEKQAGEDKAKAIQDNLDQSQVQGMNYDDSMAKLNSERQSVLQDKIDPNHFWNSKDTVGKIGTILGLLVGGFGGKDNAASKYIDDAIARDMDAQKTNKSNALNALEHQFQDSRLAADYHRVLLNDQVAHSIDLAMAKASTPQALANLQQAKGKLVWDSGVRMAQIGAQQTLNSSNLNQNDINKSLNTLRMLDPAKAKEYESRIIPNVGVATTPVNDKAREAFAAGSTFMQQMDQLEKFRQAHRGALFGAAADEGHRLAELARNSFRIAQGEGVFKAGSQHFNERLIPDPTDVDFFNKNKNAYADMRAQAQRELQNSMSIHGIRPYKGSMLQPSGSGSSSGFVPKSFKPSR